MAKQKCHHCKRSANHREVSRGLPDPYSLPPADVEEVGYWCDGCDNPFIVWERRR